MLYMTVPTENQQYADRHSTFQSSGAPVEEHEAWHSTHGSGGVQGPGSGLDFIRWHRYFIRKLEDYLGRQGVHHYVPIPYWPSNMQVPAELAAGVNDTTPGVNPPSWTTVQGGVSTDPLFGHTRLGQFRSSDELGRAIGAGYHGSVHNALGGVMSTWASPQAPIFYLWHGYLDHLWELWRDHAAWPPVASMRGNVGTTSASGLRVNLFVRGSDRKLWERYWNGSSWSWNDTGREVAGRPAVLVRGNTGSTNGADVRLNMFVQGLDNRLWERYWNGSAWNWVDTGRSVDGEPLILARGNIGSTAGGDIRLNVFVRGADRRLWERYWDGSAWSWVDTGRMVAGRPVALVRGDLASVSGSDVRINLFVRGEDYKLWERYWNGSSWTWVDTGMYVSDDPVVIVRGDLGSVAGSGIRINLFVKGLDGKLWERYWNGSSWSWNDTGRGIVGRPSILMRGATHTVTGSDVRINLFARGTDGRLWERYWNGTTWSWIDTGRATDSDPLVIARGNLGSVSGSDVRINLFVCVPEYLPGHPHLQVKLWERYWNGSAWSWVDTGRTVASQPVALVRGNASTVDASNLRVNLFVAGGDGKLWERYWNGSAWSWVDTSLAVAT